MTGLPPNDQYDLSDDEMCIRDRCNADLASGECVYETVLSVAEQEHTIQKPEGEP